MHFLAMQFAAGRTFFVGLPLAGIACVLAYQHGGKKAAIFLNVLAITGGLMVLLSGTPLPLWTYGIWCLTLAGCVIMTELRAERRKNLHLAILVVLLCMSLLQLAMELPYHRLQPLPFPRDRILVVLGDSLSMSLETGEAPWPLRLGTATGLRVKNLAAGGKRTEGAAEQAAAVAASDASVLIEIGGNDMLASVPSREYEAALEKLLSTVCTPGRTVAMFELPLVPLYNAYGRIQRRAARHYGVILIPKGILASVLADPACTVDGLHLSGRGHARLAASLVPLIP